MMQWMMDENLARFWRVCEAGGPKHHPAKDGPQSVARHINLLLSRERRISHSVCGEGCSPVLTRPHCLTTTFIVPQIINLM